MKALAPPKHVDEWGMLATGLTMILGVGGIATKLGLTGDQVTAILGGLGLIATAARSIGRRWLAARGM